MKKHLIVLTLLVCVLCAFAAVTHAAEAVDISTECSYRLSYGGTNMPKRMLDRAYTTKWALKDALHPWIEIHAPAGMQLKSLYICYAERPDDYEVQVKAEDGSWITYQPGVKEYAHVYHVFDQPQSSIRIWVNDDKKKTFAINELYVFTDGDKPDWVQEWQPTVEKADILFLVTHPDDDLIFLGGAIPTYAAEQQRSVAVAYLIYSNTTRRSELLNALWFLGVRNYPVIGSFRDSYSKDAKTAYKGQGGEEKVLTWVVDLYRRLQPEVVVTQDVEGEYGHGQHKMLADAAIRSYDYAAAEGSYMESFLTYGAWQVKKLYVHLYGQNPLYMDWSKPLEAFDGRNGLELADEAYRTYHVTQKGSGMSVSETGTQYDNRWFGLYATEVGPDVRKDDFLENIYDTPASFVKVEPAPTPEPTATPMPEYMQDFPQLNEQGFLDEGEYITADDSKGLWVYISDTLKVIINRKHDDTQPMTWYEAEIWSDVEKGEMLQTIQYDKTQYSVTHVDASKNAAENQVVFATNCDYYTYRLGSNNGRPIGIEIRDGQILYDRTYNEETTKFPNLDTMAFYPDGSMKVYHSYEMKAQDYLDMGAYQVYSFGPYLVRDGKISERAYKSADTPNPRCAVGMIEPGHYMVIMADGRLKTSKGISMLHLAMLMREKGCVEALNLDGGQTAVMVFMGHQINTIAKYSGGNTRPRKTSEIMGIGTSPQVGTFTWPGARETAK